ncbi:YeeE/YedE family protein [Herbaspirillum sp. RTI4]|uniref:YeeE/YedE family protein n=1 Tax=Herbaspirillum sp. RTI4 TaxID=3048640 RepID=UPI002AB4DBCA|nr:YeeE/YedE family protein [Herbaspirillum sp. RTI4]MDY7579242.1 YeeE/YedE family protein [Herbaspirillum sp. RTI4]MEA9982625.1 YeeE/YedE family protein [Herbaspirillum sp. RTI4]
MSITWNTFTPWSSLLGGAMIGLAVAMLVLFNGRIAGISGILGGLLRPKSNDIAWRAVFILGLLGAPLAYAIFATLPVIRIEAGNGTLIAAGLLVGVGTRYGSGCTSGHGVCGLSRLSWRSAVATAAFMSAGWITVFIVRHLLPV